MPYQHILFDVRDALATLTLNRPEVLNSFHLAMAQEVQDALRQCADRDDVRAVLLTGAGRGFCAGQDLAAGRATDGSVDFKATVEQQYNPIIRAIRSLEKPVVCAVNGAAAGAGANIALACDLVLAAENANFIQAFVKIGLIPDSGGTWILPRLVGLQRAMGMMLLGEKVSARQAEEWGLIWKAYPADALMVEATKLAAHLATQPTRGIGLTKRAVNIALEADLDEMLDREADIQVEAGRTADFQEGVDAFLAKRPPVFVGR